MNYETKEIKAVFNPSLINVNESDQRLDIDNLPNELKIRNEFIVYKTEPKFDNEGRFIKYAKKPVHPLTGIDISNRSHWMSFETARNILSKELRKDPKQRIFDGIGLALKGDGLICIDIDDAKEGDHLKPHVIELIQSIEGWVEKSVSGNVHIWTRGTWDQHKSNYTNDVEIFYDNYFVALTGRTLIEGSAIPLNPADLSILNRYKPQQIDRNLNRDAFEELSLRSPEITLDHVREILLKEIEPNPNRDDWLKVGMALHFQFEGAGEALYLWDEYSSREGCGNYKGLSDLERTWKTFRYNSKNPVTIATILGKLKKTDIILQENPIIPLNTNIHKPVKYVLKGLVGEGISLFAGASNTGKSSMISMLAGIVAHICPNDSPLKIKGRRKVVYLTEDVEQLERLFVVLKKYCDIDVTDQEINEWFKVISTRKYTPEQITKLIEGYAKEFYTTAQVKGGEMTMAPLFIIDTASASFDISDENNNSEVSRCIAALKSAIKSTGVSIWIVAHTAKAQNKSDVMMMSARGAGAWGADVQTTIFVARDYERNESLLSVVKNRIQTQFNELNFIFGFESVAVEDIYGDEQIISYRVPSYIISNTYERLSKSAENIEKKKEERAEKKLSEISHSVIEYLKLNKEHTNREDIKTNLGHSKDQVIRVINRLIKEGIATEYEIPKEERSNRNRIKGLRLTDQYLKQINFEV